MRPAPLPPSDTPTTAALSGELKIDAASSLKAAFEAIAKAFTVANPGVTIDPINYDGSSTLVTQITEGADVDIFASADQANMQKVVTAGLITGDTPLFATNTLVIAVPKGNPGGIKGLSDLENPALKIVICADAVPCGSAAQKLFKAGERHDHAGERGAERHRRPHEGRLRRRRRGHRGTRPTPRATPRTSTRSSRRRPRA